MLRRVSTLLLGRRCGTSKVTPLTSARPHHDATGLPHGPTRDVLALLQEYLKGGKPCTSRARNNADRLDAQRAFERYLGDVDALIDATDPTRLEKGIDVVPIAVAAGVSGSGKSCQLDLLCGFGLTKGFICVYFHSGGGSACRDEGGVPGQLNGRILGGLVSKVNPNSGVSPCFLHSYLTLRAKHPSPNDFDDEVRRNLPAIIRSVWNMPASTPILIAGDGLGQLGQRPSDVVPKCLQSLAGISRAAAVACVRSKRKEGPVYIAASAHSAFYATKGLPSYRVYFLPLPPLDPRRFDCAVKECVEASRPEDRKAVELLLRSGFFAARQNARRLWYRNMELHKFQPTVANAEDFQSKSQKTFEGAISNAVCRLDLPVVMDQQLFLRTLFHRIPFKVSTDFADEMHVAVHCDEEGVASVLRDVESGTDAVCMHPDAIKAVLKATKVRNPIDDEQWKLLGTLRKAMRGVAAPSCDGSESDVGKHYGVMLVSALAMRVNTMPRAMTLHELITGEAPTCSDQSFYATTVVEPLTTSLCDASDALRSPKADGAAMKNEGRNFSAHFDHPYNVALDGCILLNVRDAFGNSKRLLLGVRSKEYSADTIDASSIGMIHAKEISHSAKGLRSITENLDVVTVYAGAHQAGSMPSPVPSAGLLHGQLSPERLSESEIAKRFKHWCYMHHEHIRHWCPSVAYHGCDARVMVPFTKV